MLVWVRLVSLGSEKQCKRAALDLQLYGLGFGVEGLGIRGVEGFGLVGLRDQESERLS